MTRNLAAAVALTLSILAAGCAHKQAAKAASTTTPVVDATSATAATSGAPASSAKSCQSDMDCGDRQLCIRSQCVEITPELAECSMFRVHFDFDKVNIHADDQPQLQRMARCLKADHALHVTVEGNADERGTEEYNMALGDKRATDVARFLETLGVSKAQLKTISYGKENPLCVEHDEACWSKNRRAAVKPAGGR